LELGERPAHAVGVHRRDAGLGGCDDRPDRVAAADLHRHDTIETDAQVPLQHPQGPVLLVAAPELLHRDRGCADPARPDHPGVVGDLGRIEDLEARPPLKLAARPDLGDVRVTATAGSQDTGSQRDRFQDVGVNLPHAGRIASGSAGRARAGWRLRDLVGDEQAGHLLRVCQTRHGDLLCHAERHVHEDVRLGAPSP